MIDTHPALDEPAGILAALGSARAQERAVELGKARLVLAWLDAHPGDHLDDASHGSTRSRVLTWQHAETTRPRTPVSLGGERALQLAGIGTPLVAEFCLADLAAQLQVSGEAARRLAGDLLELRQRLPRCWARVCDLAVPLWRARKVAQATLDLTPEAAGEVDQALAAYLHTVGTAVVERAVARARWMHEPDEARQLVEAAAESRGVQVHLGSRSGIGAGTGEITATLDHLDAADFERAVATGAAALAAAGSVETLAVRRAQAVGVIARGDITLTLDVSSADGSGMAGSALETGFAGEAPETVVLPAASREVVLHVHIAEAALAASPFATVRAGGAAMIEQGALRLAPVEVIRRWCGADATTRITVRPVLDPVTETSTETYAPTSRLVEQVLARDGGCVFPDCGRPARGCDLDHVIPHGRGGPTHSQNLAPLCRQHHRLKTHGGWRYRRVPTSSTGAGTAAGAEYEWSSPHQQRFLVTTSLGHPPRTRRLASADAGRRDGPPAITIDPPPPRQDPDLRSPAHAAMPAPPSQRVTARSTEPAPF